MAKAGRQSDYNAAEHPAAAQQLARMAKTQLEIAEALGIGLATFKRWMDVHPLFRAAYELGCDAAIDHAERALWERATGYTFSSEKIVVVSGGQGAGSSVERVPITEHVPPDPTCLKYLLGNRRPARWTDKTQQDHTGTVNLRSILGEAAKADP